MAATAVSIPSSDSARPTSTDFELHSERGCDKERRAAPQLPSVPPPHSSVGDGADDEGVTLPIWLQQLPAPAACVFHFLYFDVIDARDDYHTMLRKCALAFAPLAAAAMLVLFVMDIASGAFSEDAGLGRVLAALSPPLSAVVFLVGFVIVRVSPAHNRAAIDFLLFGTLATNVVSAISDVTYPVWATSLMVAIVPLLVRSPRAPIVHLVCAAVFVISTYNRGQLPIDVEAAAQRSLAAVPDPYFRASAAARVAPCVNVGIFAIMALVVVASIVRETERRETAAKASLDVAAAIADALLDYDTTLARRVIDEARGSHTADNALLERFVVIVANLDRYRPHLPNWLVRDVSVDGHRDTHSAVATRTRRGSTIAISRADSSSTLHSVYGARSLSEDDGGATTPKGVNRIRTAARPEQTNGRFGAASIEPGTPFKARVALAEVAFAIPSASELRDARGLPDVAAAVPLMAAAGHAFVDRVHRLAGGTSGAVHAFVGDVARVSWNAAAKAVQPEAKAARFLARLKHDAGHELVRAWGAAATGDARVQLAGSRQQALLVTASGGGAEALRAGLRVAARHGAFVVDGTTYAGARHSVDFRGCGFVAPSVDGQQRGTGLFAIAREVPDVVEDWAYHADASDHPANSEPSQLDVALCDAARLAATGNFSAAADALETAERHLPMGSSDVLSAATPSEANLPVVAPTDDSGTNSTVGFTATGRWRAGGGNAASSPSLATTSRSANGGGHRSIVHADAVATVFADLSDAIQRAIATSPAPVLAPLPGD